MNQFIIAKLIQEGDKTKSRTLYYTGHITDSPLFHVRKGFAERYPSLKDAYDALPQAEKYAGGSELPGEIRILEVNGNLTMITLKDALILAKVCDTDICYLKQRGASKHDASIVTLREIREKYDIKHTFVTAIQPRFIEFDYVGMEFEIIIPNPKSCQTRK